MPNNIEKVQNLAAIFIQQAGLLNGSTADPNATVATNNALVAKLHKEIKGSLPEMREQNARRTLEIVFQMAVIAMQKGAITESAGSNLIQTLTPLLISPPKTQLAKPAKRAANTAHAATVMQLHPAAAIEAQSPNSH